MKRVTEKLLKKATERLLKTAAEILVISAALLLFGAAGLTVRAAEQIRVILQNQQVAWKDLPVHFVIGLIFMLFILAPVYSGKSKDTITDKAENGDRNGTV